MTDDTSVNVADVPPGVLALLVGTYPGVSLPGPSVVCGQGQEALLDSFPEWLLPMTPGRSERMDEGPHDAPAQSRAGLQEAPGSGLREKRSPLAAVPEQGHTPGTSREGARPGSPQNPTVHTRHTAGSP